MPFRSEKQRRYLWATNSDIARRWAHEYPESNRNLPTYARPKSEGKKTKDRTEKGQVMHKKKAALVILRNSLRKYANKPVPNLVAFARSLSVNTPTPLPKKEAAIAKKSISILQELDIPHSGKPVAAGEEPVTVKREKKVNNSAEKPGVTNVGSGCGGVEKLFNLADKEIQPTLQKMGGLLQKYAAVIRLGKKHVPPDTANTAPNNAGININGLKSGISQLKMQRAYALQQAMMFPPAGSDKKPQNSGPVATYPGTAPQLAANKPAMQSPASNPVGLKGPLNTQNGVPTFAQNVTGNASFGKGSG
jgi:hypothetical protein